MLLLTWNPSQGTGTLGRLVEIAGSKTSSSSVGICLVSLLSDSAAGPTERTLL